MIWHGTDGSDGLESGIHLRWQFDPRLGFPLEGFYLHRRSSCSRTICTEFGDFPERIEDLPYEYIVRDGEKEYKILISSPHKSGRVGSIPYSDDDSRILRIHPPIEFRFPSGTHAVEINILEGRCEIIPKVDEMEIDAKSFIGGGLNSIRFPALGKNSILMLGSEIFVSKICFSMCEDCEKPWEDPLNAKCGFGLPIKIPELKRDTD